MRDKILMMLFMSGVAGLLSWLLVVGEDPPARGNPEQENHVAQTVKVVEVEAPDGVRCFLVVPAIHDYTLSCVSR